MIQLKTRLRMQDFTKNFFDKTEKCVHQNLRRLGGTIRKIDRRSQRDRPAAQISPAGMPPYAHTRLLKDFTFFAWDPLKKVVVVGPAKLTIIGNAVQALEHGGTSTIMVGFGVNRRPEQVRIRQRPHTWPAVIVAMQRLDVIFKDSLVSHSFDVRSMEG